MFQLKLAKCFSLFLFVLASIQYSSCTKQVFPSKQSFGQACNSSSSGCDLSKYLICSEKSVCECVNKEETLYNESLRQCVVLAGGKCGHFVTRIGNRFKNNESGNCTSGAVCQYRQGNIFSESGNFCSCLKNEFYQTEQKFCDPARNINEPCGHDEQCRGLLECGVENICICSGRNKWNNMTNKCVTDVGESGRGSCDDPNVGCGRGTQCLGEPYTERGTYQCHCRPGYRGLQGNRTKDGHCYGQEDATCTSDFFVESTEKQCLPGLYCVNGQCRCKYGSFHQTYDFKTEQCMSLLGSPCVDTSDCKDPGAECANSTGISQCSCPAGFAEYERKCYKGFGQNCTVHEGPRCDISSGLECSNNGICECPELEGFNDITAKCMSLVGASCSLKDSTKSCWPRSVCTPFRGMENSDNGLCVCESGFKTVKERKCYS